MENDAFRHGDLLNGPNIEEKRSPSAALSAWLLIGITVIGALFRFYGLTEKQIWLDEAWSFSIARLPFTKFFLTLWDREAGMALYFFLLHIWLHLGTSLGSIRALSVIFSVATIPIVYALGVRLYGKTAGLLAAWVLALNAFHIRYAQEARSYAMLAFFSALATWILVRNLQQLRSPRWGAYTIACALLVYSHTLGTLIIVVHALWLFCLPRSEVPWRQVARSYAWLACCLAPLVVFSLKTGTNRVDWIEPIGPRTMLFFWEVLAGNQGVELLILEVIAIGIIIFTTVRAPKNTQGIRSGQGDVLVLAWLFIPVTALLAASLVHPLFIPRYLISCAPALALAVGAGIARIRRFAPALALLILISALSVMGTIAYYYKDLDIGRADWERPANYILDHAQPGDGIFFYESANQMIFDFYRSQRKPSPEWPESLNPGGGESPQTDLFPDGAPPLPALAGSRPAGNRVWLVLTFPSPAPGGKPDTEGRKIRDWFATGRRRLDVPVFFPIGVILYSREAENVANAHESNPQGSTFVSEGTRTR